jgi:hypothetical protein
MLKNKIVDAVEMPTEIKFAPLMLDNRAAPLMLSYCELVL